MEHFRLNYFQKEYALGNIMVTNHINLNSSNKQNVASAFPQCCRRDIYIKSVFGKMPQFWFVRYLDFTPAGLHFLHSIFFGNGIPFGIVNLKSVQL